MSILHGIIVCCLVLSLVPTVKLLRCLNCDGVADPRLCRHVTTCSNDEKCGMETYISTFGNLHYKLGCVHINTCAVASTPVPTGSGLNLFYSCHDCCDHGDLCNVRGCNITGYPSIRGPVCFNCEDYPLDYPCHKIQVCETHEVCYNNARLDFETTRSYSSGCISKHNCGNSQLDPLGLVGKRSSHLCADCCSDDLCNLECKLALNCKDEPSCPLLLVSYDICKNIPVASTICPKSCNLCPGLVTSPITKTTPHVALPSTQLVSTRPPVTQPPTTKPTPTHKSTTTPRTTQKPTTQKPTTTTPTTLKSTTPKPTTKPTTPKPTTPKPTTQKPTTPTTLTLTTLKPTTQKPTTQKPTTPTPTTLKSTTPKPTTPKPTTKKPTTPTPTTLRSTTPKPTTPKPTTQKPKTPTSTKKNLVCGPSLVVNGTRVVRGPDWHYTTNQDGHGEGVVIDKVFQSGKVIQWVKVLWFNTNITNTYRNGANNSCEIMPASYRTTPTTAAPGSTTTRSFGARVGDLVVRGPDWIYGNQDKHGIGRVEEVGKPIPGYVTVRWLETNASNVYRMGVGSKYDVKPFNGAITQPVTSPTTTIVVPTYGPQLAKMLYVGARVMRGRDWMWEEQDSHGMGDIVRIGPSGWVRVKWDNGTENTYRMGAEGAYDLKFVPGSYNPPAGK